MARFDIAADAAKALAKAGGAKGLAKAGGKYIPGIGTALVGVEGLASGAASHRGDPVGAAGEELGKSGRALGSLFNPATAAGQRPIEGLGGDLADVGTILGTAPRVVGSAAGAFAPEFASGYASERGEISNPSGDFGGGSGHAFEAPEVAGPPAPTAADKSKAKAKEIGEFLGSGAESALGVGTAYAGTLNERFEAATEGVSPEVREAAGAWKDVASLGLMNEVYSSASALGANLGSIGASALGEAAANIGKLGSSSAPAHTVSSAPAPTLDDGGMGESAASTWRTVNANNLSRAQQLEENQRRIRRGQEILGRD